MLAAQPPAKEGPKTTEDELTMPVRIDKRMQRHNKPKKAQDYVVAPQGKDQILLCHDLFLFSSCLIINVITSIVTDYACTDDDWSVIETIESEPHKDRYLVSIDDAYLKKHHLLTLLKPGEFVGDEVSTYSFTTRRCYFDITI